MDDDKPEPFKIEGWQKLTGYAWKKSFQFKRPEDAEGFTLELLEIRHPQTVCLCISEDRHSHSVEVSIHCRFGEWKDMAMLVRSIEASYEDHSYADDPR